MVRSRIKETVTLSDETMAPKEFSQKKNISKMKESQQETRDPIKRPTRYDKLSPLQKNFYYHLWKLNAKVRKRNSVLTSSDFDDQAPRSWLTGSESSQKLARQWQAELRRNDKTTDGVKQEEPHTSTKIKGPSLKRAIWRTYGAAYLLILLCVFLTDLVLEPAYFYLAIRLIEIIGEFVPSHKHVFQVDHNINHNSSSTGILTNFTKSFQDHDTKQLYSHALIFLVTIVTYQLLTHPYAWLNLKMGLRLRVALSEMIYKKSLRIDSFSATKQQISQEQASNLISRDLETLEARFGELGLVFAGPLQCLVFTLIISQQLDVWTALMACILNASACVQRSYTNFRLRKCSRLASGVADKRMDLVSETIEAIRLVRMYAWTRPLEAKIELNRNEEITHRERQLATRAVDVALFFIITSASALIALMFAYYVRGLPFTRSMVSQLFLVTATYRRALSGNLAKGMQAWTQVLVVIERCQKYLMVANMPDSSEELNERTKWIHDSSKGVADGAGAGFGQLYEMVSVMVEKPPIREDKLDKLTSSDCQLKNVSLAWPQARQATTTTKCDCQKSEAGLDRFGGQKFCLRQVDLSAQEGELVLVAGQVGSGKSTLLQILLGEMAPTTGLVHRRPGIKVAYVSQKAWIFSGSVRENILMGQTFNLERYYEVIRVSALIPDLSAFPDFDRTRIGERGVTLSGGQKARVNLARALYQRADLYLLDDPLSAVDGRVSSYIFREALRGHLRGKTIILVTHQTQYLNQVDKILYLGSRHDDSQRQATHNNFFGTFEQLERSNLLGELLACSQEHSNTDKKVGRDPNHLDNYEENNTTQLMNRNSVTSRIMSNETIDKSTDATADATMVSTQNIAHSDTSCFYQDEMYEISESRRKKLGRVRTSKMGRAMLFYMHNAGGLVATLLFALVNILSRVLYLNINIFLNFWAGYQIWSQPDDGSRPILLGNRLTVSTSEPPSPILEDDQRPNWFASWLIQLSLEGALGVAGLIWLGIIGISSIRTVQFYRMGSRAGRLIHARLIHSLLWTKLTFFDRTPQGHLINRLAADISYLDSVLIYQLDQLSVTGLSMTFVFVGIVMSSPKLMPVVCLLSVVFYLLLRHMTDLMELIKYLDGFRRSSLYSHVGTTIDGLPTIRSAKQAPTFTRKFNRLLDQHSSVRFLMASVRRLIIGSFDFILVAFYIFLVVFMLYDTLNGDGTYAFISLNLVVQLTRIAQNTMVVVVDFFLTIHSMDRIREYATELEHEKLQLHGPYIDSHRDLVELTRTRIASERQNDNRTRAATAQACSSMCDDRSVGLGEAKFTEGAIRFSGVSLKFLLTNKLVLDNVSFYIEPGLKVGIIGRTGAGKSSLITVLFHLYHFEGFVQVDGQDTKLLQLESLRKSISIIPQDPCLFTGSIRHNLDPFNEHSDEKLWRSLEVVQLKQLVQSSELGLEMPVTKSGGNFSIGQRQLICLARAILKENKILVMDEATSNIDQETDSLIQLAIKNEFKHCTVLTIAHRLSTVIELDRLMIMQDGRVAEFGTPVELLERGSNGLLCGMIESLGEQQATLLRNKITSNT